MPRNFGGLHAIIMFLPLTGYVPVSLGKTNNFFPSCPTKTSIKSLYIIRLFSRLAEFKIRFFVKTINLPALMDCFFPRLQRPLWPVAQGQEGNDDPEECSPSHRLHHGWGHLLRAPVSLRGHCRQEELGSHHG